MRLAALARTALISGVCLGAVSCVTSGASRTTAAPDGDPVLSPSLTPQSTRTIELTQTPFYPEKGYQYGPAALATVLGASGATTTPAQLTALVYLPSQDSSPQSQVQAAPQRFERLSYQVLPTLPALLAEVEAQRPVLVLLQNHAPSSAGTRYYAVLIGYNAQTDTVLLRSGTTRRQVMTARAFLVAWDNTERWAMLILRPGELPAMANRTHYLAAAAEFERGGRPENAMLVFDAALKYWPDEPLAWIGHATAQLHTGDLMAAARDYVTALRIDGSNAAGRNDLVMTLLDLGCLHKAQSQIARISLASLSEAQQAVIVATRDRVRSSARNLMAVEPPACAEFSY